MFCYLAQGTNAIVSLLVRVLLRWSRCSGILQRPGAGVVLESMHWTITEPQTTQAEVAGEEGCPTTATATATTTRRRRGL
eukprot:1798478-Amphidinium_carterae.1